MKQNNLAPWVIKGRLLDAANAIVPLHLKTVKIATLDRYESEMLAFCDLLGVDYRHFNTLEELGRHLQWHSDHNRGRQQSGSGWKFKYYKIR